MKSQNIGFIRANFRIAILVGACLMTCCPGMLAEGTVNFCNNGSIRITNTLGNPVTASEGIKAGLYWAPMGSSEFLLLGLPADLGVPLPGLFAGGTRTTGLATPGGAMARFQVRAWTGSFATYEEASLAAGVLIGQSAIIEMATGNPHNLPTPPGSLAANGLSGFRLTPTGSGRSPTISTQPQDLLIVSGSNATFNVVAEGTAPLGYQWRLNGVDIAFTTTGDYTRTAASAGGYSVVITNLYGSITSYVAVVTVHYLLSVKAEPTGKVKVIPDLPTYPLNTVVTLTAEAVPYFAFNHWSVSGGTRQENPLQITLAGNQQIAASYELIVPEIILDNRDANFTGNWNTDSAGNTKYGPDYRYATPVSSGANPTATATFSPNITLPGKYDVYAWWPSVSNPSAANNVPFAVVTAGSSNIFTLDESVDAGRWVAVVSGRDFAAGSGGYIRLFNNSGQTGRRVLADAVRLTYSDGQPWPPVLKSITSESGVATISWVANPGASYSVEYKTNMSDILWSTLLGTVNATTSTATKTDITLGTAKQRFYRVVRTP